MYVEKDQECWTAGANSKSEMVLRRASSGLYEKKGTLFLHYVKFIKIHALLQIFLPLWLMFSLCCMISGVWTVSANRVEKV